MSLMCEICGETFSSGRVKSNHVRWKHSKLENGYTKEGYAKLKKCNSIHYGEVFIEKITCPVCGKIFDFRHTKYRKKKFRKFCSRKCSNKVPRKLTEEGRKNLSLKARKNNLEFWQNEIYIKKMFKNSNKRRFTSKDEEYIRNYFIKKFNKDEWTFGGRLVYKEKNIIRDLYSNGLKICFEYDGIWHFKDIHNQLEEKQKTDKLLEEWCLENNYRLVRMSETYYLKNKDEALSILEDIFYFKKDKIVKLGKEYSSCYDKIK